MLIYLVDFNYFYQFQLVVCVCIISGVCVSWLYSFSLSLTHNQIAELNCIETCAALASHIGHWRHLSTILKRTSVCPLIIIRGGGGAFIAFAESPPLS